MEQKVRIHTSRQWVGEPLVIEEGYAEVELFTFSEMAVDERGMVNNGFIVGLGEYAAALSINEDFLFLVRADIRFSKPVPIGERLEAVARFTGKEDELLRVEVVVRDYSDEVMKGSFYFRKYDQHLLPPL